MKSHFTDWKQEIKSDMSNKVIEVNFENVPLSTNQPKPKVEKMNEKLTDYYINTDYDGYVYRPSRRYNEFRVTGTPHRMMFY
jgi:hypothetical protein